jgi:DNA-binding MarR family transcriptional regulator
MPTKADPALVASELRVVLGRLVRRLRAEHRFPLSQGMVLGRLDRKGAQSVSDLANAEGVRPQSMAQTVGDLETDGLIERRPDPGDRRRALVELTEAGRLVLAGDRRRREGWLADAIASDLSLDEQALLRDAVELLRRLAEG